MKEPVQMGRPLSFIEAVGLILLFLTVGVWGAAVTAMAVMVGAQHGGGLIGTYLMEAGADRVMRRCLMGWAALFIMVLLKRAGWRGWKDCGFTTDDPEASARPWWRHVLTGISVGLITLGSLSLLTLLAGHRIITPDMNGWESVRRALSYIASGITVALIEETVCRGMLFRVPARQWSVWPAALLTSILFSLAHFLSPDPKSFQGDAWLSTSLNIFVSTYTATPRTPDMMLAFINLTLLGVICCGFVVRTRTIWLGIGVHAAWVWVSKFFNLWTVLAPSAQSTIWLGKRSDLMDSIMVTTLMAGFITWLFSRASGRGMLVRWQGLRWYVIPSEQGRLKAWLDRFYDAGSLIDGKVLKDDKGCRVMARSGLVLKSYWPKGGWAGVRFAFRPSRARRAFLLARALVSQGIATPAPMAWAVKRRYGLLRAEYVIMTEAINAEPLTDWLQRGTRDPAVRSRVMAAYGLLMAMFHRAGYSNRDLKHENVMCSIAEPWRLQVIDLDGVRHWRWITWRRAGRDLMRVGKSLASLGGAGEAEIRAFFNAYNADVPARLRRQAFPP